MENSTDLQDTPMKIVYPISGDKEFNIIIRKDLYKDEVGMAYISLRENEDEIMSTAHIKNNLTKTVLSEEKLVKDLIKSYNNSKAKDQLPFHSSIEYTNETFAEASKRVKEYAANEWNEFNNQNKKDNE